MKLELEVYFTDTKQLFNKVWEMAQMIEDGVFIHNDISSKFNVLITKEPPFRFEEHNGVKYAVFESKMNYD